MKLAGPLVYIRGQLVTDNALIWREIDPGHRILDEISYSGWSAVRDVIGTEEQKSEL